MNDDSRIVTEIQRQGRLTRWTVVLCFGALAFIVGVLSLGFNTTIHVSGLIFIVGMMAVFTVAILRSLFFSERDSPLEQDEIEGHQPPYSPEDRQTELPSK